MASDELGFRIRKGIILSVVNGGDDHDRITALLRAFVDSRLAVEVDVVIGGIHLDLDDDLDEDSLLVGIVNLIRINAVDPAVMTFCHRNSFGGVGVPARLPGFSGVEALLGGVVF